MNEDRWITLYDTDKNPMTDSEFDNFFKSLTDAQILKHLEDMIRGVTTENGERYSICAIGDLRAVVEQELYQKMTGRE